MMSVTLKRVTWHDKRDDVFGAFAGVTLRQDFRDVSARQLKNHLVRNDLAVEAPGGQCYDYENFMPKIVNF
jgi:hypothetical protein